MLLFSNTMICLVLYNDSLAMLKIKYTKCIQYKLKGVSFSCFVCLFFFIGNPKRINYVYSSMTMFADIPLTRHLCNISIRSTHVTLELCHSVQTGDLNIQNLYCIVDMNYYQFCSCEKVYLRVNIMFITSRYCTFNISIF